MPVSIWDKYSTFLPDLYKFLLITIMDEPTINKLYLNDAEILWLRSVIEKCVRSVECFILFDTSVCERDNILDK